MYSYYRVTIQHKAFIINDAMDELLSKLNVAIGDMEQGRVQSIDDAWKEIDRI